MKKIILSVLSFSILYSLIADDLPIIEYGSINHPVISDDGMVVSQRMIASKVGAEILQKGGNAVCLLYTSPSPRD